MATSVFEVRPGRLTRSLVLVAVVIGVAAGAMACAAGLATGRGHEHAAAAPTASAHAGHADVDVAADVDAGVGVGVVVDASEPDDDREASEAAGHPGMSCVVEVDLEFVDEHVAAICDRVAAAPVVARTQGSDGPEPPVPRSS